jgi:hypothetical protein
VGSELAAAINQGPQYARGEYLVLLNNDAVVTEGWLGGSIGLAWTEGTTERTSNKYKDYFTTECTEVTEIWGPGMGGESGRGFYREGRQEREDAGHGSRWVRRDE